MSMVHIQNRDALYAFNYIVLDFSPKWAFVQKLDYS